MAVRIIDIYRVQGATSVRNGEIVPYDLDKFVHGFETEQYHGAPLSSDGKSKMGHGNPVLP